MPAQRISPVRRSVLGCPFAWEGCLTPLCLFFGNPRTKTRQDDLKTLPKTPEDQTRLPDSDAFNSTSNWFLGRSPIRDVQCDALKPISTENENPTDSSSPVKCDFKIEITNLKPNKKTCDTSCKQDKTRPGIKVDLHVPSGAVSVVTVQNIVDNAPSSFVEKESSISKPNPSSQRSESANTAVKEQTAADILSGLGSIFVQGTANADISNSRPESSNNRRDSNECMFGLNDDSKMLKRNLSDVEVARNNEEYVVENLQSLEPLCCIVGPDQNHADHQLHNVRKTSKRIPGHTGCEFQANTLNEVIPNIQILSNENVIHQKYPNISSSYANIISMNACNANYGELGTNAEIESLKHHKSCSNAAPIKLAPDINNNDATEEVDLSRASPENETWNQTIQSIIFYPARSIRHVLNHNLRRLSGFVRSILTLGGSGFKNDTRS